MFISLPPDSPKKKLTHTHTNQNTYEKASNKSIWYWCAFAFVQSYWVIVRSSSSVVIFFFFFFFFVVSVYILCGPLDALPFQARLLSMGGESFFLCSSVNRLDDSLMFSGMNSFVEDDTLVHNVSSVFFIISLVTLSINAKLAKLFTWILNNNKRNGQ